MKVVSANEMLRIEKDAYRDGFSEESFMKAAGKAVAKHVQNFVQRNKLNKNILLLCGKGNNGGDSYVAGRYLIRAGYKVTAIQLTPPKSKLCILNQSKFRGEILDFSEIEEIPFTKYSLILDGIFGTGFKGPVQEPYASVIRLANQSGVPIISIDIPSGLDGNSGSHEAEVIEATETIYLELPKTGFFLLDAWNKIGKIHGINFGLNQKYIDEANAELFLVTPDILKSILPPIIRNRHKYEAGYVVGLAGSPGMPGAALLSSLASLRSGAGIVRLLHPKGMENELTNSPYELIKTAYNTTNTKKIIEHLNKASATFLGPGIGREPKTKRLLLKILPILEKPCVIDADALTLLANEDVTFPPRTILTPHHGEMQKLLGKSSLMPINFDFLQECYNYAKNKNITLILKGAPTFIIHPDEEIMVNISGDPGMATAGSGDVLTGIVSALLASGLHARHAAILGAYLHGIAGEKAAYYKTSFSMIASDIIDYLPFAFKSLI